MYDVNDYLRTFKHYSDNSERWGTMTGSVRLRTKCRLRNAELEAITARPGERFWLVYQDSQWLLPLDPT